MNARDELAGLIAEADGSGHFLRNGRQYAYGPLADAILAAGYRKPLTIDNEKLVIDDGLLLLDVGSCTCSPYGASHEPHCGVEYIDDLTKPLARAGYSKPRQVSTVEELDALPVGSVVRCAAGMVFEKYPDDDGPEFDFWLMVGESRAKPSTRITLPATVLYEPEQP